MRHWIERKAGPAAVLSPDEKARWTAARIEFVAELRQARFGSIVLDYDGTISDPGRIDPAPDVRDAVVELLSAGISLGVASGRGSSLHEALRSWLPERLWRRVLVAHYNGDLVLSLMEDFPGQPAPEQPAADMADLIERDPSLPVGVRRVKARGRVVAVDLHSGVDPAPVRTWVAELAARRASSDRTGSRVYSSGASIEVLLPGVSKRRVAEELVSRGLVARNLELLAIGDQGDATGNDYELLQGPHSLTVDRASSARDSCWYLPGSVGATGPVVTTEYLAALDVADGRAQFAASSFPGRAKLGAACIVTDPARRRVFLQRKDADYRIERYRGALVCVGGEVESGESPGQAMVREVREELLDPLLRDDVLQALVYRGEVVTTYDHRVSVFEAVLSEFGAHAHRVATTPPQLTCSEGTLEVHDLPTPSGSIFAWDADMLVDFVLTGAARVGTAP